MFNFICPDLSYLSLIIKLKGDKNMITNEEVSKIIYEEIKDELERKPLTKEEINNPLNKERKEALYNAIFCYDEQGNICGYNIQARLAQKDIYKLRFYLPIIDSSWNGVRKPQDLPDKRVKIGFDGEYISQNELLKKNDIELAIAMFLNIRTSGTVYLGGGVLGLINSDILYSVVRGFKYAGFPINDATKRINATKLFV